MKKFIKKQVTLIVITFMMLSIVIFGSSYALFEQTFIDTKTQSLSVGDLNIVFSNGTKTGDVYNELDDSSAIDLDNQMPISDKQRLALTGNDDKIYSFVIYNSGTIPYAYTIKLIDNENYDSELSHNYIRYKLNDDWPSTLGDKTNDIIYDYTINPGETHTFQLRVWIAEAEKYNVPNEALGADVHLNILIEGEAGGTRAPKNWQYAKEGTLLYGIKQNNPTLNTGGTTPGQEPNNGDEGLKETRDDYGTSYYYRGSVTNNYVLFANKCWRIVRIDGNGNIKLIFENDANNCNSQSNALDDIKFNSSSTVYTTVSGAGFMYGDVNANNYDDAHANINDSTILASLKTWYDTTFETSTTTSYTDLLADVIWCGDKNIEDGQEYGTPNEAMGNTLFSGRRRLGDRNKPTLICNDSQSEDINLSRYTAKTESNNPNNKNGNGMLKTAIENTNPTEYKYYKVGLLTADEVTFAGGYRWTNNSNYYLVNNTYWWTMSPGGFIASSTRACVWYVLPSGNLNSNGVTNGLGVRPAVSLISTAEITGGTGISTDPFVISV